ncbi:MAG: NTP transferase domain-containing protein, partial [Chitinophagaceae bacterium]|nr:NTP transferase domain-containing protein [Chitinophagaceae bacterium]
GTPKQLLSFEGKSLLKRITGEALAGHPVTVVLGAYHEMVAKELTGSDAAIIINPQWENGMSGSIRLGLSNLLSAYPDMERCIITVCDQPFVNAQVFRELALLADKTGKGIVSTGFAGTYGVPVLFSKKYFGELLSIEGKEGAKKIIQNHPGDMAIFPFDAARFDIDTQADYFNLSHEMVGVQEAQDIINYHLPDWNKRTTVAIQHAGGYTLASDIIAAQAIPNFAQSSMDGYAIRYEDRNKILLVTDKIPAGETEEKILHAGEAMRIFTGAPLPKGADTVVMQEKVLQINKATIQIQDEELQPAAHVRPIGAEVERGAVAIKSGAFLTPAAIGYLAGIGCSHVEIFAPPKIAIILTGNELRPLGKPLGYGEVYESNSYQLRSALEQLGIKDIHVCQVPDDEHRLKTTIETAIENHDILLLVGGVSVGDYDYVVSAVKACGIQQHFHRVRQKPGKPLFFGSLQNKLLFGLPGNPASALTCFYLYVAPALERLMQLPERKWLLKTRAAYNYTKKPGLTHFLKAHYDGNSVVPLHAQESYRLQSFSQANCLLILNESSAGCKEGDEVDVYPLNG